jgi:hypothetical protein
MTLLARPFLLMLALPSAPPLALRRVVAAEALRGTSPLGATPSSAIGGYPVVVIGTTLSAPLTPKVGAVLRIVLAT